MKQYISEATDIIEDKFKIRPRNVVLTFHENMQDFLTHTNNPQAQSMFTPADMNAHVPKGRLELVFHEYHGHGLFCEHTPYGQRMVEDEKHFPEMSQKEIQQALSLHEFLKPDFEGHALWTEDFLLTSLQKTTLLEQRLVELESLAFMSEMFPLLKTQRDVYNRVKQFEQRNGIFQLWYTLGFPRQFDKATLVEIAKEKLTSRFNDLLFLIHFGSTDSRGDIDLCAVLKDNVRIDEYEHSRTIDLSQFEYSDFLNRMGLFDIPVTEPLMTGDLVYGDEKEFQHLVINLKQQRPNPEAIKYLHDRKMWCLDHAIRCFDKYTKGSNALEVTLNDLAYTLSFHVFAETYQTGSSVITFSEVHNQLLSEIRLYMKSCESGDAKMKKEKVERFLARTRYYVS